MTEFIHSFEEVDTAMFDVLSGLTLHGKPVDVTYYTPDVDLADSTPPALVLYRTTPMRDLTRQMDSNTFRDNPQYDESGKLIAWDERESPEPWSIMYTVKSLYEYQTDGVALNDRLIRLFGRGDFITINGVGYTVEQLTAGLWGSQYKDFGRIEDGQRRFQETYSFRVDVFLEVGNRTTSAVVQEVGLVEK